MSRHYTDQEDDFIRIASTYPIDYGVLKKLLPQIDLNRENEDSYCLMYAVIEKSVDARKPDNYSDAEFIELIEFMIASGFDPGKDDGGYAASSLYGLIFNTYVSRQVVIPILDLLLKHGLNPLGYYDEHEVEDDLLDEIDSQRVLARESGFSDDIGILTMALDFLSEKLTEAQKEERGKRRHRYKIQ